MPTRPPRLQQAHILQLVTVTSRAKRGRRNEHEKPNWYCFGRSGFLASYPAQMFTTGIQNYFRGNAPTRPRSTLGLITTAAPIPAKSFWMQSSRLWASCLIEPDKQILNDRPDPHFLQRPRSASGLGRVKTLRRKGLESWPGFDARLDIRSGLRLSFITPLYRTEPEIANLIDRWWWVCLKMLDLDWPCSAISIYRGSS